MKIILVMYSGGSGIGGQERVTLVLTNYFNELGHEVVIWSNSLEKFAFEHTLSSLTIEKYHWLYSHGGFSADPQVIKDTFQKANPDLIIFNHCVYFPLVLISHALGIKNIMHYHISTQDGSNVNEAKQIFKYLSDPAILGAIAAHVVLNKKSLEYCKNTYPSSRWELISNYVAEPTQQDYNSSLLLDAFPNKKIIASVGRIEGGRKRQDILIKAFAHIAKKYSDWIVVFLGNFEDSAYQNYLKSFVSFYDLQPSIHFFGNVTNIYQALNNCHFVASTSFSEGMPLSILESLTMKKPVIAFNVMGTNEIIRHGHNGLLVESIGDSEMFSQSLEAMITDDTMRKTLSSNAGEIAKEFTESYIKYQWSELLNSLKTTLTIRKQNYIVDLSKYSKRNETKNPVENQKIYLINKNLSLGGGEMVAARLAHGLAGLGFKVGHVVEESRIEINTFGIPIHQVPHAITPCKSVRDWYALHRFFSQHAPTAIITSDYSHYPNCFLLMAMLHNVKVIRVVHILIDRNFGQDILADILRKENKYLINYTVVLTDEIAEFIKINYGFKRLVTIPNFAHYPVPNTDPIIEPSSVVGDAPFVFMGARLFLHHKRQDLAIKAFALLAGRFPTWKLVLAGDPVAYEPGSLEKLNQMVEGLGLEGRVLIISRVGNIADWYQRCAFTILTSAFEGLPLAVLESMSYGKPVISFDIGGPRSIITHGEDGLLVSNVTSVEEFSNAMALLMEDSTLRESLGKRALEVRERFGREVIIKKWELLLEEVSRKKNVHFWKKIILLGKFCKDSLASKFKRIAAVVGFWLLLK
ncbi:MAG: glycosyltransferase [Methylacidiphilales bacterium]|nr:glycosyltransferase [Candidatus Methylacidiphilales bacterium]